MTQPQQPLAGVRVLDLSRIMAGPSCTQLLSDLGADVVKVERPGVGDDTRQWGPPWLKDEQGNETREASYYLSANRGKRSITVNINSDGGRDLIRKLAVNADILVENFKVGDLARKGLGWDDLRTINPALVYISITGFGQTGPLAAHPGYDYLAQGLGGLMSVTGRADGEDGAGPLRTGVAVADLTTGLYATVAALSGVMHSRATGVGQHVDLALLDTQMAILSNQAMAYLLTGTSPGRSGTWHPSLAPYQVFEAADGPIIIAVGNDRQYATLCNFIARPDLIDDPRFVTNPDRNQHRQELATELAPIVATHKRDHWSNALPEIGVPCASVNSIGEAFDQPQAIARGTRIDLPTASGNAPGVANPIKFSETPVQYAAGPPRLGEHTDEVLTDDLGLSADAIEVLRTNGDI